MSGTRRENVQGGRLKRHEVKTTPEEDATIALAAQQEGVSWVRFTVESALAVARAGADAPAETRTARRARLAQLFALQGQVGELALQVKRGMTNVNQIARGMHQGQPVPVEEMREFLVQGTKHLTEAREVYDQITVLIDELVEHGAAA